jgi:hypothetical protein
MTESSLRGRLIALDGTDGPQLQWSARRVLATLRSEAVEGGVSSWDASGIFYELRHGTPNLAPPTPRTLVLLYASDLLFRLRWEIRPALAAGKCVIAAPYVESAMAFGKAARLSKRWMLDLFRFAPRPQTCYSVHDSTAAVSANGADPMNGFFEFCCHQLSASSPPWSETELKTRSLEYFDRLKRMGRCSPLPLRAVEPT